MSRRTSIAKRRSLSPAALRLEDLEAREMPASFVSYSGGTYTQNFDALGTSTITGLNATTSPTIQYLDEAPVSVASLNGWALDRTDSNANFPLTAGTGSSATGGAYNFGTAAATSDRALGTLLSGSFVANLGVVLRNDSTAPISQLNVTFNSEQYRRGTTSGSTTPDQLDFQYLLGAVDISAASGWINVDPLDAVSVNTSNMTVASIDGNGAGRAAKSATIEFAPATWGVGQTLVLRWVDLNITGSDDGLAVDDFVISVPGGSTAPLVTSQPVNLTVTAGGTATFTAAASGSPAPSVQWFEKAPGGSFTAITNNTVYGGATTDTLTITGATVGMSGNQYRAVYTNSAGTAPTNDVTLTVNSASIAVNPATLPNPVLATAYSQTVTATGGGGTFTFTVSTGAVPAGLTLSPAGVLAGTPTASGTFDFTVLATDAFGSTGTRAYTLVVPLVVGPASLPDGTRGVPYSQTVTATGGTAPYTFAVSAGFPTGLSLDTITGAITGTPDTAGTFNFTVTATNGVGRSGSRDYTVVVAPSASVAAIARVGGEFRNTATVSWTVTFSQAVSGIGSGTFTLSDVDNSLTGEGIASVTAVGGGVSDTQWTVVANTGTGDGRLRLNATSAAGATPTLIGLPTNVLVADFTIDKTAPAVSISGPSVPLAAGGPVTFTVSYTGADTITLAPGNVILNATGGTAATVGIGGSGNTRTVTLSGITGNGTLGISLQANTASDLATNAAPTAGPSTTFDVDNTPPTVTSVVRVGSASVTNATQVQYTVTFSEPVTPGATPFTTTTTGSLGGVSVAGVSGGPTAFTVTVNTGTGDGTIRLDVPVATTARDTAGNAVSPFAAGELFTLDRTPPAVTIGQPSSALTAGGPVTFEVTYTDANLSPFTLAPAQIMLNPTSTVTATVGVTSSGTTQTVTLSGITGTGTLGITVPAGTVADAAGNLALGAGPSTTFTVDNTAPTVTSVVRVGSAITNAAVVRFEVTFSESVTGVTAARFMPVGGTLSSLSVAGVSGGPSVYFVDVNTGSGDGLLRLDVPASSAITDAAGNALAVAFTTGQSVTLDRTPPTVSISAPTTTLTRGGPVSLTITYSDLNGVTPTLVSGDVILNPTGGATASVAVSGSGNTRTVTLSSIAGNGTLGISLVANSAVDGASNPAPAVGPSAIFTVDNAAPLVTSVVRTTGNPNPTNATPALYTVTFNEDVGTPPLGAFSLTTTGTIVGAAVSTVTPVNARTYTVAVATGTGDGTLRLNVTTAAPILDAAGNPLAVSFTTGDLYTVLKTAPSVATNSPANGSVVGPVGYTGLVSGTAIDALGGTVSSVAVTIQRSSDGSFWSGSTWAGSGSLAAAMTGTTWSVLFPAAAHTTGLTYTIVSTATDAAGNVRVGTAVAYQWDASPAAATVSLPAAVYGPGSWPGAVGGAATDTGPAGVAVVNVSVTRSSDGFSYNAATQTWAAGTITNAVTPATGVWALPIPAAQLEHAVSYTVSAAAVDAVGNAQAVAATGGFAFDAVAPTSAITAPAAPIVGPVTWPAVSQIGGTVADTGVAGVAVVTVRVTRSSDGFFWNGTAWQSAAVTVGATVLAGSWTYTLAAAALSDGITYTVTSTATDAVGNVQAIPGSRSFIWDAATPTQSITTPTNGSFAGPGGFTGFDGTVADPGAAPVGVVAVNLTLTRDSDGFVWNGAAFVSGPATFPAVLAAGDWTYSFDPAALTDGTAYSLTAAASDAAGNVGTPAAASFTFDAAGPTTTITTPAAGLTATASNWTGLAGTAADGGASVQFVEYRVLTAGGQVWNGGAFAATGGWFAATGTTSWSAAFPFVNFPAGGGYRVEARGVDAVGNVGMVAAVDFTVALPTVTTVERQSPTTAISNTTAPVTWRVTFSDPVAGVTAANFALDGSFSFNSAILDVVPVGGSAPAVAWDITVNAPAAGTGTLGLNYISATNITPAASSITVVGEVYTLDHVAPTVRVSNDAPAAVVRANQPVRYTVTFADDTAVGASDLTPGDVTNAVVTGGATFTVGAVSAVGPHSYAFDVTLTGAGEFQLQLAAVSVADAAGNLIALPVLDAVVLTADAVAPIVVSVVPDAASPTRADSVSYTVTFSEPVSGVDAADFFVYTTGSIVPGAVTVNAGSGTVFTVTFDSGSGDGTIRLDVLPNGTILDGPGNTLAAEYITADVYEIDRTAPTASAALASGQATPTAVQPVRFTVTFTEAVGSFDVSDVTLVGTAGGFASATTLVTNPLSDGRTFLVEVSGLTEGTVGISVAAGTAADAAGNLLADAVSSPLVTLDLTAPTVSAITRVGPSATNAASVDYTVTFTEAVAGVDAADFSPVTTLNGASITSVVGGGTTWTVTLGTGSGDGTLRLDLRADATATDAAGNVLPGGGFTGDEAELDRSAPTATVFTPTPALRNTPVTSVAVTFSEPVTGLDVTDFTLTRDGVPLDLSAALVTGGDTDYSLDNLSALTGVSGVYVLTLTAGTAGVIDAAINLLTADSSATFTVDADAPTVTITADAAGPTNLATVGFTVTFTETVVGVDTDPAGGFDFFAVTGAAPGAAIVSVVPGAAGVYTVTVGTGSGEGTIGLSLAANASITDAAGNAVAGLPAASGFTAVDRVRPTVSISDADPDGVVAVNAAVAFTVDVLDAAGVVGSLTSGDFENAGTAGVSVGAVTSSPIAGGTRFAVAVTPTTGGTLLLRLKASAAVRDPAGNDPDLPVIAGRTLVVDAVAPGVTVSRAADQAALTNAQPIRFAVVFSEQIVGFGPGSVSLAGPGTGGASVSVTGDGQTFEVTVSGLTADGTVTLAVPAGVVTDVAGNANAASAGGDNAVTLDTVAPAVGEPVLDPVSDTGAADGITADATPTFTGTAELGATVELFEGSTRLGGATATATGWSITSTALGGGPHTVFARATDAAGNVADSGPLTVVIDATRPTVAVTRGPAQADTLVGGGSVTFAVTTSESVGTLNPAALSVVGTAGGSITAVTGSDSTFVVTVGGITRPGSVSVAVAAGAGADAAGNLTLASPAGESVAVQFATTTALSLPAEPTRAGEPLPVGALVSHLADGAVSGTVTVTLVGAGGTFTQTVPALGAAVSFTGVPAGGYTVTAAFAGTGGFLDSIAAAAVTMLPALPTGQNSTGVYAAVTGTTVTLFDADGSVRGTVVPFSRDESPFGTRVAVADVTGDGVPDVVAGTAPGTPAAVRVLDGATGATLYSFGVFEGFRGGVFVAAGDLNGDGKSELVVSPDQGGGARVVVFDGATGLQLASFLGIQDDAFRGGARVAVGDINADGVADLLVSAGFGGGPRVAGFDGASVAAGREPKKLFNDFFLFAPDLRDGVFVTVGDVDGDGYGDVIGGAGLGGAPRVLALSGFDLVTSNTLTPLANFFAGSDAVRGGVRVAAKDFDGDGRTELVTGSGDTGAVIVYTNAGLASGDPTADGGLEMVPGLLPGVHVG